MRTLILVFALFLVSGCAGTSKYAGDSEEAVKQRRWATRAMLEKMAPDECIYDLPKKGYECYEATEKTEILNMNIDKTRAIINDYLLTYPSGSKKTLGRAAFTLYGCTDIDGKPVQEFANHCFCQIQFSRAMVSHLEGEYMLSESKQGDLYRYILLERH